MRLLWLSALCSLTSVLTGCATVTPRPSWAPVEQPDYSSSYVFKDVNQLTVEVRVRESGAPPIRLEPGQVESAPLQVKPSRFSSEVYEYRLMRTRGSVSLHCTKPKAFGSEPRFCSGLSIMEGGNASARVSLPFRDHRPTASIRIKPRGASSVGWSHRVSLGESSSTQVYDLGAKSMTTTTKYFAELQIRVGFDWSNVVRHQLVRGAKVGSKPGGRSLSVVLLDAQKPVPAPSDFTGRWNTSAGPLELTQQRRKLSGTLVDERPPDWCKEKFDITGLVVGDVSLLQWRCGAKQGKAILRLSSDGQAIAGCRGLGDTDRCIMEPVWQGTRVARPAVVAVPPPDATADTSESDDPQPAEGTAEDASIAPEDPPATAPTSAPPDAGAP